MKVFWTGRCLHSVIDVFLILNFDDQFCHDESQLDFKRVKVSQTWLDVFLKFKFFFFFFPSCRLTDTTGINECKGFREQGERGVPLNLSDSYIYFLFTLAVAKITSCELLCSLEYFFLLCWMGNPQKLPYQTIIFIGGLECFNQDYIT